MQSLINESPELFAFGDMQRRLFEFEELLRNRTKIAAVAPGSVLEHAGLAVMKLLATYKREMSHDRQQDHREEWRKAISLSDILRKVLSSQRHPAFDQLWPHILLLLGNSEIAQNVWSPKEDGGANKVFELYVALLALPLCRSISMDDPVKSSGGDNPDVIAEIEGISWTMACKVMHSTLAKSLLDRVRDGILQIDRSVAHSPAHRGIVVISLKNVLNHNELWPITREQITNDVIYQAYLDSGLLRKILECECKRYESELLELLGGKQGFRDLFAGSRAEPLILVHLSTVVGLLHNGRPAHSLLRMLGSINVDPLPPKAMALCSSMNEVLQDTCFRWR
jgi:hypothetical protein